jgi:protoporphyrin/coproporphyrin ferrochelatase
MEYTSVANKHPKLLRDRVGVLIMNLGTPEATDYWSVRRYLSEFLSDKRVISYPAWLWQPLLQGIILSTRPVKSGRAYQKIWNMERNESPLKTHTREQCDKLNHYFSQHYPELIVEWGMRYGNPSIASSVQRLLDQGVRRVLLFALYPQYSAVTVASAYDKAFAYLATRPWQPAVRTAVPWCDDPDYISLLAASIQQQLAGLSRQPEVMLTSFHGLPKRNLQQGDPYYCFCAKTSRLLREKLAWPEDKWYLTFQSRFGAQEWLQPYTDQTIKRLAAEGVKHLAIISPAFVSDCIETLEEINIGLRELYLHAGGEQFTYIPCLNASDAHIHFLAQRIEQELQGWLAVHN